MMKYRGFLSATDAELVVTCRIPRPARLVKEARYLRVSDPINLSFLLD
jgi:hypothetical protein